MIGLSEQQHKEIAELEDQIAGLAAEQKQAEEEAREYFRREAAGEGPFAQEIFGLKQKKMMLATQIQHLKVRINRIMLLGMP